MDLLKETLKAGGGPAYLVAEWLAGRSKPSSAMTAFPQPGTLDSVKIYVQGHGLPGFLFIYDDVFNLATPGASRKDAPEHENARRGEHLCQYLLRRYAISDSAIESLSKQLTLGTGSR